ncbi:MAG: hypothetical protein SWX82_29660 [Cyanobacteriota bacterium]|nr:hypothetical protein [Cyanobacteriota bacterium]
MNFSPELISLARYLAGEFDNSTQAIADHGMFSFDYGTDLSLLLYFQNLVLLYLPSKQIFSN